MGDRKTEATPLVRSMFPSSHWQSANRLCRHEINLASFEFTLLMLNHLLFITQGHLEWSDETTTQDTHEELCLFVLQYVMSGWSTWHICARSLTLLSTTDTVTAMPALSTSPTSILPLFVGHFGWRSRKTRSKMKA